MTSAELEDYLDDSPKNEYTIRERYIFLLMLVTIKPDITALRASEILGVSSRTVENYFNNLKKQDIIDRIGGRKEGRWVIKKV